MDKRLSEKDKTIRTKSRNYVKDGVLHFYVYYWRMTQWNLCHLVASVKRELRVRQSRFQIFD